MTEPLADAEASEIQAKASTSRWLAMPKGMVGLRLVLSLAMIVISILILRVNRPWVTVAAIAFLAGYILVRCAIEFRIPEKTATEILGGTPSHTDAVSETLIAALESRHLLHQGEKVLAAIDDSWTRSAARGVALTSQHLFTYSGKGCPFHIGLGDVSRVFIRRLFYPSIRILGRGQFFGKGPVVILRMRFDLKDGTRRRLRLSQFAADLYPLVALLLEQFGEKVRLGRVLPGL